MTRRGSVAYYSAAVVVGCFFMTAAVLFIGERSFRLSTTGLRDLFFLYFLGLAYGWFTTILFALLLRRITRVLRWTRGWQWGFVGAMLAPALIGLLYGLWSWLLGRLTLPGPQLIWWVIFAGPIAVMQLASSWVAGISSAAAMGAATGLTLSWIHRAFEPQQTPQS